MSVEPPRRELSAVEPSPSLRDALDAARQAGPSPQRLAAAREALLIRAGALDPSLALQGAGAANAANAGQATQRAAASLKAGSVLGKILLSALGGAVVSAAVVWQVTSSERHTPAPLPSVTARTPSAAPDHLEPAEELQAPNLPQPSSAPAAEVNDSAHARERRRARRNERERRPARESKAQPRTEARASKPKSPEPAGGAGSTSALRREVSLLSLARDALQDRPRETLRLTAEHARLFPQGRFVQEREVLAVHALLRRGERDAGIARGEQFLARYPNSTHSQRVAGLLESARQ